MANAQRRLPAVITEPLLRSQTTNALMPGEKSLSDLWEDLDLLGPNKSHYAGTIGVLRDVSVGESPKASMADDGTTCVTASSLTGRSD